MPPKQKQKQRQSVSVVVNVGAKTKSRYKAKRRVRKAVEEKRSGTGGGFINYSNLRPVAPTYANITLTPNIVLPSAQPMRDFAPAQVRSPVFDASDMPAVSLRKTIIDQPPAPEIELPANPLAQPEPEPEQNPMLPPRKIKFVIKKPEPSQPPTVAPENPLIEPEPSQPTAAPPKQKKPRKPRQKKAQSSQSIAQMPTPEFNNLELMTPSPSKKRRTKAELLADAKYTSQQSAIKREKAKADAKLRKEINLQQSAGRKFVEKQKELMPK
jgi:hypothetical protein